MVHASVPSPTSLSDRLLSWNREIKHPYLFQIAFGYDVYHSNRKATRILNCCYKIMIAVSKAWTKHISYLDIENIISSSEN